MNRVRSIGGSTRPSCRRRKDSRDGRIRDWTERGTILRHNYWHDIAGAVGFGGKTIYLDDQQSG